jgi:hypothetical protein
MGKPYCVLHEDYEKAGVLCDEAVRVYRNLNKGCYSVQQKSQGRGTWRVVCYAPHLELLMPQFVVSTAGRERVLREQRKNVHAFVIGHLSHYTGIYSDSPIERNRLPCVRYNPYKADAFLLGNTRNAVDSARVAILYPDEVRTVAPEVNRVV